MALQDEDNRFVSLLYPCRSAIVGNVSRIVQDCKAMSLERLQHTDGTYTAEIELVNYDEGAAVHGSFHEKLRVLLDYGEHAREYISAEVGLHLIELLADKEQLLRQLSEDLSTESAQQVMSLLACCVSLQIVPMENHNGRVLVERDGQLCERKNGRGVDPNRNWDVHWGYKEADFSAYEENPGVAPFSEPEVALMKEVAERFKPHVWIAVHSGMEGLFMPFDHIAKVANGPNDGATLSLLHDLNKKICHSKCTVGSGGASVGYLAHGTATDYMFTKLHVPLALTWEIYGDFNAAHEDCFRIFNPVDPDAYDVIIRQWTTAVFYMLLLLQDHPAVHHLQLKKLQGHAEHAPTRTRATVEDKLVMGDARSNKAASLDNPRLAPANAQALHSVHGQQYATGWRRPSPQRGLYMSGLLFLVTATVWCIWRQYLKKSRWRMRTTYVRAE